MYIRDHTCIYIYVEQPWKNMKTYKCEDPYHCSTMRSSPETCGTFQQWRNSNHGGMAAKRPTLPIRWHLFFDGTILIALFHIFLRRKTQKKTPPPSETRNCTICFIGLPIDFPIPLLNKFIDWKSYLTSLAWFPQEKVKTCQSLTPSCRHIAESWPPWDLLSCALTLPCVYLQYTGQEHLQKHARYWHQKNRIVLQCLTILIGNCISPV